MLFTLELLTHIFWSHTTSKKTCDIPVITSPVYLIVFGIHIWFLLLPYFQNIWDRVSWIVFLSNIYWYILFNGNTTTYEDIYWIWFIGLLIWRKNEVYHLSLNVMVNFHYHGENRLSKRQFPSIKQNSNIHNIWRFMCHTVPQLTIFPDELLLITLQVPY